MNKHREPAERHDLVTTEFSFEGYTVSLTYIPTDIQIHIHNTDEIEYSWVATNNNSEVRCFKHADGEPSFSYFDIDNDVSNEGKFHGHNLLDCANIFSFVETLFAETILPERHAQLFEEMNNIKKETP